MEPMIMQYQFHLLLHMMRSSDDFNVKIFELFFTFRVIDHLNPGVINFKDKMFQTPKIEAMRVMRERERIADFTKRITKYGVTDTYAFPTESLHEKGCLNLAQVCCCIRALGSEVRILSFVLIIIIDINDFLFHIYQFILLYHDNMPNCL